MDDFKILEIFEKAGIKIELGATYSVKGQIAQLLNGADELIKETKKEACNSKLEE